LLVVLSEATLTPRTDKSGCATESQGLLEFVVAFPKAPVAWALRPAPPGI